MVLCSGDSATGRMVGFGSPMRTGWSRVGVGRAGEVHWAAPATSIPGDCVHDTQLVALAAIVVLAIGGQVLATKLRVPSILVLLVIGLLVGPVTGLLDPDALLGEGIFPIVALAVSIILFEGGLLLNLEELRGDTSKVVRRLLVIGVPVTAISGAVVARYVLGISTPVAAILGAVLTVSGPTVVLPLLRFIRPTERVEVTLKWEGIFVDAIGAALTVFAFEAVRATGTAPAVPEAILQVLITLLIGGVVGVAGAWVLVLTLDADLVDEPLEAAVTVMIVIAAFVVANLVRAESGLFTAIIMGVVLANQHRIAVDRIAEFKETLGMVLTGVLFIVLSARLDLASLRRELPAALVLTAILVIVVRPVATMLATAGSDFSGSERGLVGWMAPRGIVAAATASLFAFELRESDVADVDRLVPLTFLVILLTVTVYGLTGRPVARMLGVAGEEDDDAPGDGVPGEVDADDTSERTGATGDDGRSRDDGAGDDGSGVTVADGPEGDDADDAVNGDASDAGDDADPAPKAAAKDVARGLGLDPDGD